MSAHECRKATGSLPHVTLVTPTYNQAQYLAQTIDSVLAQSYPNYDYLIIDDGSTDGTQEVLRGYGDRLTWQSQDNRGQAAALNTGWARARGEIIGYLSSDDMLRSDAISECVAYLVEHPEIMLVYPDFELIDSRGRHIRDVTTPEYSAYDLRVNMICQPGPGALFRKSGFDAIGGWNVSFRQVPDYEYWLRLSHQGPFMRVPKTLSACRVHGKSQSYAVPSSDRAMEPVRVINKYYGSAGRANRACCYTKAVGRAHLLAARMLLRSGRFREGLMQVAQAVGIIPGMLITLSFWRILIGGILSKLLYRL